MTLEYSGIDRILTIKCDGSFSAIDIGAMTRTATERLISEHAVRILLDFSTAITHVPINELYRQPDIYASSKIPKRTRTALITPADGYRIELYKFYADVCLNRGFNVRLFNDAPSAKNWLMET